MNGLPIDFRTMMGESACAQASARRPGPRMMDGSDGPARLVFESSIGRRHAALLDRWLALIRVEAPAAQAERVVWLLDAGTVRWSGGFPPGELHRGATGLNSEETPILWFRASSADERRRGFTALGVFGAAGIVDAARVRVAASRMRRQTQLRVSVDAEMWGLSARPASCDGTATMPDFNLTITASGALRPAELKAIRQWL